MSINQIFDNAQKEFNKYYGEDNLGKLIGSGLDGRVFEFGDKVIKFTRPWKNCNCKHKFIKILDKAKEYLDPHLVRVYEYGKCRNGVYWYIMERLKDLNKDERHAVNIIGDLLYNDYHNFLSSLHSLNGIQSYLADNKIDDPRYAELVLYINTCGDGHGDFCSINIMKRKAGSTLVAIDLESFVFSDDNVEGRGDCYKYGECFDDDDF